jgi:hypothetical protein
MILGGIIATLVVLPFSLLVPGPAQAYGSLTVKWITVDTDNCARRFGSGGLTVTALSDRCYLDDSADDTWFIKDPGGVAIKIELHDSSGMVAKIEFHPHGEHLWVYDTRNDGDAIYTRVFENGHPYSGTAYSAPGTSSVIDYRDFNLSMPEGNQIQLAVNDNASGTDTIVRVGQIDSGRA